MTTQFKTSIILKINIFKTFIIPSFSLIFLHFSPIPISLSFLVPSFASYSQNSFQCQHNKHPIALFMTLGRLYLAIALQHTVCSFYVASQPSNNSDQVNPILSKFLHLHAWYNYSCHIRHNSNFHPQQWFFALKSLFNIIMLTTDASFKSLSFMDIINLDLIPLEFISQDCSVTEKMWLDFIFQVRLE